MSRWMLGAAGSLVLLQPASLGAQGPVPLEVEIVIARSAPVERDFEATGEVVAREAVALAFPTGGRVLEVLVEDGMRVEAEQLLARIDPVQQEQTLRAARAGLATAEANGRQATDDLVREEALLVEGATTRARRDEAVTLAQSADALILQAIAAVETAEKALADTELTAPVAGQVISRDIEPGQVVSGALTVMELATNAGFDAVFNVPESLVTRSAEDAVMVQLSLIDGPSASFEGVVREVSPQVDPTTGTVEATVTIEDGPDGLAYGVSIRGSVSSTEAARISLPSWALVAEGGGAAVWVVDPATSTVELRPISVLRHVDEAVIVSDGVSDGERVVSHGAHLMFPGRVVVPAEVE